MNLGRVGVWLGSLGLLAAGQERAAVQELERLGFGTLWIGESHANREAFSHAALLLEWTQQLTVATGIASIWARDAVAAANGAAALAEAHPGRFVLGLGVSHAPSVARRGHRYVRPLSAMRGYLDAMDAAEYRAPPPPRRAPVVLAALAPPMLALAAERADGAHPYLVTPEHTRAARVIIGEGRVLAPEQGFILRDDPSEARAVAREHLRIYLGAANYQRSWRLLGLTEEDWRDEGSDRLVDALVAWGDEHAVIERLRAHFDGGADHVAVQALGSQPLEQLRRIGCALASTPGIRVAHLA